MGSSLVKELSGGLRLNTVRMAASVEWGNLDLARRMRAEFMKLSRSDSGDFIKSIDVGTSIMGPQSRTASRG